MKSAYAPFTVIKLWSFRLKGSVGNYARSAGSDRKGPSWLPKVTFKNGKQLFTLNSMKTLQVIENRTSSYLQERAG